MRTRFYLVFELVYGAALLATITAAPDITIKLRVNYKLMSFVNFSYPTFLSTIFQSLILTALAMLPTVGLMPSRLAGRRRYNYLVMAPWILKCCLKFLVHSAMQLFTIRQVTPFNDTTPLAIALCIYCIFFGMAAEMMLHWIAIANILVDTNVLVLL